MSVSEDDLEVLSNRAKGLYRGNISALVHDMVASLKREQAADDLLRMLGGERIGERKVQAIRDEVSVAPVKRRRRRRAA